MKKILVIFTGGTIGSRIQNSTINVDEAAGYYLLEQFRKKSKVAVEFDTLQPMNILSENCTSTHWQKLCDTIKEVDTSLYDGIIVTHGSDTLPYTAALLSFLFHYIDIPVVVTGSNYALEAPRSNGLYNFISAVEFIVSTGLQGVYTTFQNNNGENRVFLASRLIEADSYNDQFLSYGGIDLGALKDGQFNRFDNPINPTIEKLLEPRQRTIETELCFKNKVFAIRPYPGLDYQCFNFKDKPKAILHSLYHSATGCTSENEYSLPDFIKKCTQEGIDFYLISFKDINSDLYLSSRALLQYGAIPLHNISFEAAYAKLNIAYNQKTLPPQAYMKKEMFFEFLPKLLTT
jgi:L-asparaginase